MGNSYHKMFIGKLMKNGRWLVNHTASQIQLTKTFGGKRTARAVSVLLEKNSEGKYTIEPANYDFRSVSSHFDYLVEENRWTRNKNVFHALVGTLKAVGMWPEFIENTEFIKINENNKKASKTNLEKELNSFL
jgi:hypothetical protein